MTATLESTSPQAPSDVIATVPEMSADDVRAAYARAKEAARSWATGTATSRSVALDTCATALARASDEMAELVVREVGKPLTEARGEVARGIAILRYYAQLALLPEGDVIPSADGVSLLHTRRKPHGVAGLITPWNFPVAIPLWKAAPALAFGNTVLLKPAEESPACALRLAEIFSSAFPEGVFQVVTGGGEAGAAVISVADVVSFTGSTAVGASIRKAAAERGIPAQCEMGGQNASIVLPDADLAVAARVIAGAAMGYAGQKCTATSRVIVVGGQSAADAFAEQLGAAVAALSYGDPASADTVVGPVINSDARSAVVSSVSAAVSAGGVAVTGGTAGDSEGWYVSPAVVSRLAADDRLLREEVFGPVCAVVAASDADDAVRITNSVPYGLVAAVFTDSLGSALKLVPQLEVGMAKVNAPTSGVDYFAPFGGDKDSSYGPREQGTAARDFYTKTMTVTFAP
ncbi:aldehyde dehydrogenase (NAD+) [Motilibacter peucedani]|uniref:Aldehyde dehydrogenase (NAD+) n=1 Tax=Motilibacter peucedani TaxID=598650 RepID=A0A420XRP5_9ACTN|nr:aldehyde dehydrogenase family protein [Motilibacter peucedani]RKS77477.1 aldehyde dehydrogenase (NAD+) [Motilibacter peucedani]